MNINTKQQNNSALIVWQRQHENGIGLRARDKQPPPGQTMGEVELEEVKLMNQKPWKALPTQAEQLWTEGRMPSPLPRPSHYSVLTLAPLVGHPCHLPSPCVP